MPEPKPLLRRKKKSTLRTLVETPTDPEVIKARLESRQIWWDGKYDGYWRVLLGPMNWANPERAGCFPSEDGAIRSAYNSSSLHDRWAKVFSPEGKLVASFAKGGKRSDGGLQPNGWPNENKPKTLIRRRKKGVKR